VCVGCWMDCPFQQSMFSRVESSRLVITAQDSLLSFSLLSYHSHSSPLLPPSVSLTPSFPVLHQGSLQLSVSFVVVAAAVAAAVITFVVAAFVVVVTKIVVAAVAALVALRRDFDPVEWSLFEEFGQNRLVALLPIELHQMGLPGHAQTGTVESLRRTVCPRWRADPPG